MLSLGLINHFLLEYSLTDYGSSLGAILDSLCTLGEAHLEKKKKKKKKTGILPCL